MLLRQTLPSSSGTNALGTQQVRKFEIIIALLTVNVFTEVDRVHCIYI